MNRKMGGNSIGISLILVIFILLCLITFGTLSYMLSDADNEMSISSANNIMEYYESEMLAQEKLQEIDETLASAYLSVQNEEEYWATLEAFYGNDEGVEIQIQDGATFLVFQTDISEKEVLISELEVCYPAESGYYRIVSWTLESISDL